MVALNLPSFDIHISGTEEKPTVFDILRKKHVALTPEEWVRQHFVHYLIEHRGYPSALLANEVKIQCGEKTLRADSVLYNRELHPVMIIEYKAPDVAITQKVFEQAVAYNSILHVDYIIVSNGLRHFCCKIDYENKKYLFFDEIPTYQEILQK